MQQIAILRPGDTVVCEMTTMMPAGELEEIERTLESRMPQGIKAVLLPAYIKVARVENAESDEPTYPCEKCGVPRTKAEGGTTFTVCDKCWDKAKTLKASAMASADDYTRYERKRPCVQRVEEQHPRA